MFRTKSVADGKVVEGANVAVGNEITLEITEILKTSEMRRNGILRRR